MNIDDVKGEAAGKTPLETLKMMFARQRELMVEYGDIERKNGANVPFVEFDSIQDAKRQWRIKEDFWRTTEEIAEAWEHFNETVNNGETNPLVEWRKVWDDRADVRHVFEELADAFHFFIEATIHSGECPESLGLGDVYEEAKEGVMSSVNPTWARQFSHYFIESMGLAANELKNKPWKQSQMETDVDRYSQRLRTAWRTWFKVWHWFKASHEDFYDLYFRKSEVNKFRQRSNY